MQEDAFLSRVVGSMGSNLSYERARERGRCLGALGFVEVFWVCWSFVADIFVAKLLQSFGRQECSTSALHPKMLRLSPHATLKPCWAYGFPCRSQVPQRPRSTKTLLSGFLTANVETLRHSTLSPFRNSCSRFAMECADPFFFSLR